MKRSISQYMDELLTYTGLRHRHLAYEYRMGEEAYAAYCLELRVKARTFHNNIPITIIPYVVGIGLHPV